MERNYATNIGPRKDRNSITFTRLIQIFTNLLRVAVLTVQFPCITKNRSIWWANTFGAMITLSVRFIWKTSAPAKPGPSPSSTFNPGLKTEFLHPPKLYWNLGGGVSLSLPSFILLSSNWFSVEQAVQCLISGMFKNHVSKYWNGYIICGSPLIFVIFAI